jgi:F0F1-type ATP synthase assembly protein I
MRKAYGRRLNAQRRPSPPFKERPINFVQKISDRKAPPVLSMDDDTRKMFRTLGYVSTLGLAMAISIVLGALIGHFLDARFRTEPWLFFIFLGLGIAAAFRNLYIMYKKIKDI